MWTASPITPVAISPDGSQVLSGRHEIAKLWEVGTGKLVREFKGSGAPVRSVSFSRDGTRILSSGGPSVRVWNPATGRLVRRFVRLKMIDVPSAAFSPDGTRVLAGSLYGVLTLWHTDTGKLIRRFGYPGAPIFSVAFSPDGVHVLSVHFPGKPVLWNADTGEPVHMFEGFDKKGFVESAAFSPDGSRILSSSSDGTVKLWDVDTKRVIRTFRGHRGSVRSIVAFSPDGRRILQGGADGTVKLWDADTGHVIRTLRGHDGSVNSAVFSPDSTRVLSGGADSIIRLWEIGTGKLIRSFKGHTGGVDSVAFSPDGRRMVSGSRDTSTRLWDVASGEQLALMLAPGVSAMADDMRAWLTLTPEGFFDASQTGDRMFALVRGRERLPTKPFTDRLRRPDLVRELLAGDPAGHYRRASSELDLQQVFSPLRKDVQIVPQLPPGESNYHAAFFPDGAHVVTGGLSADNLKLWDTATGQLLRTFEGHPGSILRGTTSVAVSPDGARVLSGGGDRTVKLWDAAAGGLIHSFEGHESSVEAVAFSSDGTRVLSGSADGTMKLWDATSGRLVRTFLEEPSATPAKDKFGLSDLRQIRSVAFSADGAHLLSGNGDGTTKLWDAVTGQVIRVYGTATNLRRYADETVDERACRDQEAWLYGIKFAMFVSDGTRVLSVSRYGTVTLWDTKTGRLIATFREDAPKAPVEGAPGTSDGPACQGHREHLSGVRSVIVAPDGSSFLSVKQDAVAKLWDVTTGKLIRSFDRWVGGEWSPAAFSPDGTQILIDTGNTLNLRSIETGRLVRSLGGSMQAVNSVAFSPDGTRALTGNGDNTVNLWDADTGRLIHDLKGHTGPVNSVAFSPDGSRVLSGSNDRTVKLWNTASGKLIRSFEHHSGAVNSVVFLPNGRALSGSSDKMLKLWDTATGRLVHIFEGHAKAVNLLAISPDGSRVLSSSVDDRTVKLWDAAAGRLIRSLKGFEMRAAVFSPEGSHVLSAASSMNVLPSDEDRGVKVFGDALGQMLRAFGGFEMRAAGSGMGLWDAKSQWDTKTAQVIRVFEGDAGLAYSVAFSPDGTRALSGSSDGIMELWDVKTGDLVRRFKGNGATITSLAFSPDGSRILSGTRDGTTRIWSTVTGEELVRMMASPGGWTAMTRDGFFSSSHRDTDMLTIVRGLEMTTMGQVHQSLFNPDLVREALAGDPAGEVAAAAKVISLEKVLASGPAPSVAIVLPADGGQSAADLIAITARIEDRGKGVGRIEWRVNGITAAVAARSAGRGPVHTVSPQLALDPGDNAIEVVAYNNANVLASLPARTTVKFTGTADKTKPKLHILAIGIDEYEPWTERGRIRHPFPRLTLAVKDANSFAIQMERAAGSHYSDVIHHVIENATRDTIDKEVARIAKDIHPRDTFILFAAAHGMSKDGRFYLIPQDHKCSPELVEACAIGQDHLQDWLANRIRARKALILIDTCESGAVVAGHLRSRLEEAASEAGVGRLHEATGRPVLTAAAQGQYAREGLVTASGARQGFFTYAILDALTSGDSNGNELIELSELVAHVQDMVPKLAAKNGGIARAQISAPQREGQTPRFGSRGEDFVIASRLP